MNKIIGVLYIIFMLGTYLGLLIWSIILILGVVGFIINDWDMWNRALANPHVIDSAYLTVLCIIGYIVFSILANKRILRLKRAKKRKQSKNTYRPL